MQKDLSIIVDINNRMTKLGHRRYEIAKALGHEGSNNGSWLAKKLRKAELKGYNVVWNNIDLDSESSDSRNSVKDTNLSKLTYSNIPSKNPPVKELWEKRINEFKRVKAHADSEAKVTIKVNDNKPIGLALLGDPHIDNPGCNVVKLLQDIETIESTPYLYAINAGDTTDNWFGYLSKLYSKHETTQEQSFILLEDLIKRVPWLFMVRGNHSAWQETFGQNLLNQINNILEIDSQVNVELLFNNNSKFNIHSRHNYPGNSQWNTVHGQVKYAKMRGAFDILVGGHTHSCGYNWVAMKDVHNNTYRISHCENLGSYKQVDDYAITGGFEDTNVTPSVMYILDPTTDDPTKKCMRFANVQQGAEYLTYLRSKY